MVVALTISITLFRFLAYNAVMNPSVKVNQITVSYDAVVDKIITSVSILKNHDSSIDSASNAHPFETHALWDTGSACSSITLRAARALEIISKGDAEVVHMKGRDLSRTYLIDLILPDTMLIEKRLVTEFENEVGDFDLLIGMDIISMGDLSITNFNQRTVMTFRIPSLGTIDFITDRKKQR